MAKSRGLVLALAWALVLACDAGPAALSPEELVEAFIGHTQAADRTMHLEFRMDTRFEGMGMGGAGSMSYLGTLDVAGPNHRAQYSWRFDGAPMPGEPMRIEVVSVNGRTWQRDSLSQQWLRNDGFGAVFPAVIDPFSDLTAADLEYTDVDDAGYEGLHRLVVREPAGRMMRMLGADDDMDPDLMPRLDATSTTTDIYVDDEGIPLAADMRMAGRQDSFGMSGTFMLTISFVISDWGAPIEIRQPAP